MRIHLERAKCLATMTASPQPRCPVLKFDFTAKEPASSWKQTLDELRDQFAWYRDEFGQRAGQFPDDITTDDTVAFLVEQIYLAAERAEATDVAACGRVRRFVAPAPTRISGGIRP